MRNGVKWLVGEGETQNHVRLTVAITHILNVLTSVCSSMFEWKRRALEHSCNYSPCGQSDLPWHGCPVWVGVGYLADSCALEGGNVQRGVFTLHADSALPVFFQLVSTPQQTITACRNIHVTSALHYLNTVQPQGPTIFFYDGSVCNNIHRSRTRTHSVIYIVWRG